MRQFLLYCNWEPKRDSQTNSKLRCTVVARIYTWAVRGLNDPIKGNKVICYLKDHKILHFIRVLSTHKVKALMGDPHSAFSPLDAEPEELALLCNKALNSRVAAAVLPLKSQRMAAAGLGFVKC